MLRIHVLGDFKIYRDGLLVPSGEWHTRQARQLLKVLLTEPGRVISSDRLMELLWPEADETAAASLRSAINALRSVLEPQRLPHSASRYVPRGNNGYKFLLPEDSSVWVDLIAFEQQLEKALALGQTPSALPGLSEALKLYTGDYLPEDQDESWAWPTRERLKDYYLQGMLRLAELQYSLNQLSESLATGRKALAVRPLSEPLYRLLMRVQTQMGDRAGALVTFEQCRQVLDDQLGVDPSAATLELHSAILQGNLNSLPSVSSPNGLRASPPARKIDEPSIESEARLVGQIVGRKTELARLLQQFSQVKQGETRTVALVGEAGIGKSTLAALFLERLQTTSARVLTARCQSVEEKVTFAPITVMLSEWRRLVDPAELTGLPQVILAQVAALVPGLYVGVPDLPNLPFINADHAYGSLIAALVDFFVALSQAQPLVLVWDDIQWADHSTLRLINRLANLQGVSLLSVIVWRAEDMSENALLTETVRGLQRGNRLTTLNLARFTIEETAEYIRLHHLENQFSPPGLQHLVQGNPLFLAEAVRVLEDEPNSTEKDLTAIVICQSPQIRDIVLARLARLPDEAANLLEIAAVIGRPFTLDLLKPVLAESEQSALSLLLARRFLVDVTARDDQDMRLAFAHNLSGQIIYQECSPVKRRQLHLLVAQNMIRRYQTQPGRRAAEIAEHFRQAGSSNRLNILHYEIEAGDYARRTASFRQALSHYHNAEQALNGLSQEIAAQAEAEYGRLYQGYALAYEALLDWSGVQASYRRLWEWAEQQGDVRLAGSSALHIVFTRSLMGYLPEAAEIGQSFLAHFERVVAHEEGDPQKSLQIILTIIHHWRILLSPPDQASEGETNGTLQQNWPPLRAIKLDVDSQEVIRLLGPVQAAYILAEYGRAFLLYGQLKRAEGCLQASLKVSEETNQIASWVIAAMHLSRLHRAWGNDERADYWHSLILSRVATIPEAAWVLTWPQLNQAYNCIYRADLGQAQQLLEQLEKDLHSNSHFLTHRYSLQIGWGILEQARGNLDRASQLLEEALSRSPFLYLEAYILAELALAQIAEQQGRLPTALQQLTRLLRLCGERGLFEFYYQIALEIVRMLLANGQTAAAALLRQIEPCINQADYYQHKLQLSQALCYLN